LLPLFLSHAFAASHVPPNALVAPKFPPIFQLLSILVASIMVVKMEQTVSQHKVICLASDNEDNAEDFKICANPSPVVQTVAPPFVLVVKI